MSVVLRAGLVVVPMQDPRSDGKPMSGIIVMVREVDRRHDRSRQREHESRQRDDGSDRWQHTAHEES